jgi:predicted DNA-binding transcriptional regulator AlpA
MPGQTNENTAEDSPFMEIPAVCRHYGGRSRSWVYTAVANGDLPAPVKIGGKILFSRSKILAFDAEREAEAERETQARRANREVA